MPPTREKNTSFQSTLLHSMCAQIRLSSIQSHPSWKKNNFQFFFFKKSERQHDRMGGVTLSYVCPHCSCFPLDHYIWWVSSTHGDGNNRKMKHCSWWCAACGCQFEWRAPNRTVVVQKNVQDAQTYACPTRVKKIASALTHICQGVSCEVGHTDTPSSSC